MDCCALLLILIIVIRTFSACQLMALLTRMKLVRQLVYCYL